MKVDAPMKTLIALLQHTLAPFILLILLCSQSVVIAKKKRIKKSDVSSKSDNAVLLSSGIELAFTDKKAAPTLQKWARELDRSDMSISHNVAVHREQQVLASILI
jgi:hypothetical protein